MGSAPDGWPVTDRVVLEGEPLTKFTVTVNVAVSPAFTVRLEGKAVNEKSNAGAGGMTVN